MKMNIKLKIFINILIILAVIFCIHHLIKIPSQMDVDCSECITSECQDSDILYGDFEYYYFKSFLLIMGIAILAFASVTINFRDIEV